MKTSNIKNALLSVALIAGTAAFASNAMAGDKERVYKVKVANAMLGQPVAPSVIATHNGEFSLFEIGPAPTMGDSDYDSYLALAAMAETGFPFHVDYQVSMSDGVWDTQVLLTDNGPMVPPVIFPGNSNYLTITASGNAKYLSAVGMLGMTNDAVYAVRGAMLPRGVGDKVRVYGKVYDIGSEANAESAATIGALGAMDENPETFEGINVDGEGYIHIHNGVHGIADLSPAAHDWRNPGVEITIKRIQ